MFSDDEIAKCNVRGLAISSFNIEHVCNAYHDQRAAEQY
jgi:hypothetical protein